MSLENSPSLTLTTMTPEWSPTVPEGLPLSPLSTPDLRNVPLPEDTPLTPLHTVITNLEEYMTVLSHLVQTILAHLQRTPWGTPSPLHLRESELLRTSVELLASLSRLLQILVTLSPLTTPLSLP